MRARRTFSFLGRMTKGDVLLAGYSAMILALVLTAVEAQQIHQKSSEEMVEIYHRHLREEERLDRFRGFFSMGGIYAREFLLNPNPDRASVFRDQLAQLKTEARRTLDEIDRTLNISGTPVLRAKLEEFWNVLETILDWPPERRISHGYEFVQREIAPRRNAAGDLARELIAASEEALSRKEIEFSGSRDSATIRLFFVLPICLLFGYAASYFSLARTKTLERQAARQHEELAQAKRDLEQLSARIWEVQEDERRRISRELHDEIGQTLTALRIEISQVHALLDAAPEAQQRLQHARTLAERTIKNLKNLVRLLRPALLDDLGLAAALEWQAMEFSRRTGIGCHFFDHGLKSDPPDAYKTCAYRIVQQALHNCETHAGATQVRVSLRQFPQELHIEVEDDGRGFEPGPKGKPRQSGGLGILGMRERVAPLGGALSISSAPGEGTQVTLSLPLPQDGPSPERTREKTGVLL